VCLGLSVRPAEASIPHGHEELKMRTGSYHGRPRGSAGKRPADLLRASPRHPFPMRSRGPRRSPAPPLARAGQAARRDKRPTAPILSRPAPITSSVRPWRCGEARERHGCGHPDRTARAGFSPWLCETTASEAPSRTGPAWSASPTASTPSSEPCSCSARQAAEPAFSSASQPEQPPPWQRAVVAGHKNKDLPDDPAI
jgi:hypothetical protein